MGKYLTIPGNTVTWTDFFFHCNLGARVVIFFLLFADDIVLLLNCLLAKLSTVRKTLIYFICSTVRKWANSVGAVEFGRSVQVMVQS